MSTKIAKVHARQVIDSRGNPTVEADVILEGDGLGEAQVQELVAEAVTMLYVRVHSPPAR